MYMAKKYNKSFKYELASNTEDTFYRHSDNSINISKYGELFLYCLQRYVKYFTKKCRSFEILVYFCRTKIEAIHNKDYSVVKTFKAGHLSRFFLCSSHSSSFFFGDKNTPYVVQKADHPENIFAETHVHASLYPPSFLT